jgi:hypothetical protein
LSQKPASDADPKFIRQEFKDGTVNLICTTCYRTVILSRDLEQVERAAREHKHGKAPGPYESE